MIGILDSAGNLRMAMPDDTDCAPWLAAGETTIDLPTDYDPTAVNYRVEGGVAQRNPGPTIAAIKVEAERRILAVAPLWRQINDLYSPEDPDAVERRAAVNVIRLWSNDQEALVLAGNFAAAWPNEEKA